MGFFDNLSKSISDAGQGAIQKGKDLAEVSKINSSINEEEKKIVATYEKIGRKYEELFGDSCEGEFKEMLESILKSKELIADYQKRIKEIKKIEQCPSCGAEVPAGTAFCSVCGSRVTPETPVAEEPVEEGVICKNCGAKVALGMKFCTGCGAPVDAVPTAQEAPVEETSKEENENQEVNQ